MPHEQHGRCRTSRPSTAQPHRLLRNVVVPSGGEMEFGEAGAVEEALMVKIADHDRQGGATVMRRWPKPITNLPQANVPTSSVACWKPPFEKSAQKKSTLQASPSPRS